MHFATLHARLRQRGKRLSFTYPALIPQRAIRALGNVLRFARRAHSGLKPRPTGLSSRLTALHFGCSYDLVALSGIQVKAWAHHAATSIHICWLHMRTAEREGRNHEQPFRAVQPFKFHLWTRHIIKK